MAQFGIAYVALGFSILLLLSGLFLLLSSRGTQQSLSSRQRLMVIGGFCGLLAFLTTALVWWNGL